MTELPSVIVNADDYGISADVNRQIMEMVDDGLVTSVSLLANGPAFDDAISRIAGSPRCSTGVHLNLTEFAPLAATPELAHLYDQSGAFNLRAESVVGIAQTAAVAREWGAQIRKVQSAGIAVSHLDSHHHVHTVPALFLAIRQTQREFDLRRVRTTRNLIPLQLERGPRRVAKVWQKRLWHYAFKHSGARTITTQYFGSVTDFVLCAQELPPHYWSGKTIELMCHPGHPLYEQDSVFLRQGLNSVVGFPIRTISYTQLGT